ncbi:Glu/Leu/Phe/Val dehydrogenase dimerization domain-containing protein [Sphaerisporangium sp. NPDC051017]|uniref:Glu/Leu/Phe/Val dehydrogenase family protein n=1 Tax=Sphaerisporangium sp. NPDC051017 TaxID=3154636 RepID=UPI00343EE34C
MQDSTVDAAFDHERVVLHHGRRSGLPVIAAVHSTTLGNAVGGARLWTYPNWRDGLTDALRLSAAMSLKNAAAGLAHGGGKAVIALPPGTVLSAERREAVLRDLGDLIDSLGGAFIVGEDVGMHTEDMLIVREQTPWADCLPTSVGGIGEPAEPTSVGVYAAIEATARQVFGTADLNGRRACVVGLGQVGQRLARRLAAAGAKLTVSDIDPARQAIAGELSAAWTEPGEALFTETDLLVPAALGGILTPDTVPRLRCAAIVGPANNQLSDDAVADTLAERGVLWAPDFIVNAGGVIYGVEVSLDGISPEVALSDVRRIGDRLASVFARAERDGVTPLATALADAIARLTDPTTAEPFVD